VRQRRSQKVDEREFFYRDAVIIAILFISGVTRLWFISELGALIMKPIPAVMTYSYAIDYTESSSVCFT